MAERAAILRWTGRGKADELTSSVKHVLAERKVRVRATAVGGSLVLADTEPATVCSIFEFMPGVAWTAVGYKVAGEGGVAAVSRTLASRYLRRGTRFSVHPEATGGGRSSDLGGAVTSAMLEEVKGARAYADAPGMRFRAALDGEDGVVGAQISSGPGGTPTGESRAVCLVSGGRHSSVLAWDAVLQGFRVNMVHAFSDERSLFASARLYAELSNRADPRGLSLTVLEGGQAAGLLREYVAGCRVQIFGGFTVGRPLPPGLRGRVQSPLYMMPEESFEAEHRRLGVNGNDAAADWGGSFHGRASERTFGGKAADVSGVLDGLG